MKSPVHILVLIGLYTSLLLTTFKVFASGYECIAYGDRRFISLNYPGQDHLCEVSVTKQNNEREVKWYADHDSTFCSNKLDDLVNKYRTSWNFDCQRWPDHLGLAGLAERHRKLVDSVVKKVIAEGKSADLPFRVTGARTNSTQLNHEKTFVIALQLFLQYSTDDRAKLSNRTYYIRDDGSDFQTTVISDLETSITPPKDGYQINSAIVSAVLPSGQLEVSTTLLSPTNLEEPHCLGIQKFTLHSEKGTLESQNQHRFFCKI